MDDDKSDYHHTKSNYGVEETFPEGSQSSPQGLLQRTLYAQLDSDRRANSSAARPMLPTVQSGIMSDIVVHNSRYNKRRKSSATKAISSSQDSQKLGTFEGVFTPTVLSIWSIIVFLRFGYIIAQVGVIATLMMFSVGYLCVIIF